MVYFAFPKAAIRFSSFEACSSLLTGPPGNEDKYNLGSMKGFLAGLGAGAMEATFVTTPQETIKVRLINDAFRQDGKPPQYKSFFHGVKTIVGEYGVSGIYKGLFPTIIKVSTAQATRFGVFQYIPADMVRIVISLMYEYKASRAGTSFLTVRFTCMLSFQTNGREIHLLRPQCRAHLLVAFL